MKDKTRQTLELGVAIKAAKITLTISDEEAKEILSDLDWVDKEMAKKYGFVLREEDRLKIKESGAEFLEEVGGEIGSSSRNFIARMTGNGGEI